MLPFEEPLLVLPYFKCLKKVTLQTFFNCNQLKFTFGSFKIQLDFKAYRHWKIYQSSRFNYFILMKKLSERAYLVVNRIQFFSHNLSEDQTLEVFTSYYQMSRFYDMEKV